MTETQILAMLGTIWIAPHVHPLQGKITGCIILVLAGFKGLGWL